MFTSDYSACKDASLQDSGGITPAESSRNSKQSKIHTPKKSLKSPGSKKRLRRPGRTSSPETYNDEIPDPDLLYDPES